MYCILCSVNSVGYPTAHIIVTALRELTLDASVLHAGSHSQQHLGQLIVAS